MVFAESIGLKKVNPHSYYANDPLLKERFEELINQKPTPKKEPTQISKQSKYPKLPIPLTNAFLSETKKVEFKFDLDNESLGDLSVQEQTINSLVINCYNLLSQSEIANPTQISQMFYLIRTLTLRLGEKEILERLDELFENIPLTDRYSAHLKELEHYYLRDIRFGYSLDKSYNNKQIKLRDILLAMSKVKRELLNIFTYLAISHNIDVNAIQPPNLGEEEMPEL